MMNYENLLNRYKTNFAMMHHYKYSLEDIENMMPWERYAYLDLIKDFIKQEEQAAKDRLVAQQAMMRKRK